jgi:hypothetical protein
MQKSVLNSEYGAFDLDQDIMKLHNICDDIDLFLQQHLDGEREFTADEVHNILYGLRCMHELRINRVHEGMTKVLELNEYCTDPEKLKNRSKFFGE